MPSPFAAAAFAAAALLFLLQPMVARMMLPRFGGGAAVWTTCVAFFQAALLAGYVYAHLLTTRLAPRRQVVVHLALLVAAAAVLPVAVPADWAPAGDADPVPALLAAVAAAVGLPFVVLAGSAPLLQRWYAGPDPYRLYAAGNAGSLLGLLAYPVLVEPAFGLRDQAVAWAAGYAALVVLFALCARTVWAAAAVAEPAAAEPPVGWGRRAAWVGLAAVPSSLMLGVTAALSTDLPPVPLLWVAPLALYLLTFVVAFGRPAGRLGWVAWAVPVAVTLEAVAFYRAPGAAPALLSPLAAHLAAFAAVALGCHAELAATRPGTGRLTEFYLCLSAGGVLGGLVNAAAPTVFNSVAEFPLALAAAAVAIPAARALTTGRPRGWLLPAGGIAAAAVLYAAFTATSDARVLHQERSFYGVTRVVQGQTEKTHQLMHGTVEHGAQVRSSDPARPLAPLLYYHPEGPIGQVFVERVKAREASPVGVVGLGCGSLAYYWLKDQPFVFYELDPAVIRAARNPDLFTFLRDSKAKVDVVPGDARVSLGREPDGRFGLLVVDAFSGDAIPVHLLTAEALELYARKLAPGGAVAFHVSSNYFDLEPVVAAAAARAGLVGRGRFDRAADLTEVDRRRGRLPCHWLLVAPTRAGLRWVDDDSRWQPLAARPGARAWTDDRANVLGALRALAPASPARPRLGRP